MLHSFRGRYQARFREARYQQLRAALRIDEAAGFILDLGGGPASFLSALHRQPQRVILVDREHGLVKQAKELVPGLKLLVADAERLPFIDGSIAVTVCNSVIEHVQDAAALAAEIRRVSVGYFVQTPNGRFPVEFHVPMPVPFYWWIPWRPARRWLCHLLGGDFAYVESVRYPSAAELARYFPGAQVVRERYLGLTKSFYVIFPATPS